MNPVAPEQPDRARVAVIGGGVHVVNLVEALARRGDLPPLDLSLTARHPGRLEAIGQHTSRLLQRRRPDWTFGWTTDTAEAVRDAAAVVLLVRVGGAAARQHDEQFPTGFGLVGDEGLGPGGLANAWRTVPALRQLAGQIAAVAPDALVVNLVAPLGLTTQALLDSGVRAVGACELPTVVLDRLVAAAAPEHRDLVADGLGFGGLNHLSWYWPSTRAHAGALEAAAHRSGLIDEDTWECFGGVPMPYYFRVVAPDRGASLGLRQPARRAAQLADLSERALGRMRSEPGSLVPELSERSTPWFDLAVVPVLSGWLGGRPYEGPLTVEGADPVGPVTGGASTGAHVGETRARVRRGEVTHRPVSDLPAPIADFLRPWFEVERLALGAAWSRDRDLLHGAVDALPFDLSSDQRTALTAAIADRDPVAA